MAHLGGRVIGRYGPEPMDDASPPPPPPPPARRAHSPSPNPPPAATAGRPSGRARPRMAHRPPGPRSASAGGPHRERGHPRPRARGGDRAPGDQRHPRRLLLVDVVADRHVLVDGARRPAGAARGVGRVRPLDRRHGRARGHRGERDRRRARRRGRGRRAGGRPGGRVRRCGARPRPLADPRPPRPAQLRRRNAARRHRGLVGARDAGRPDGRPRRQRPADPAGRLRGGGRRGTGCDAPGPTTVPALGSVSRPRRAHGSSSASRCPDWVRRPPAACSPPGPGTSSRVRRATCSCWASPRSRSPGSCAAAGSWRRWWRSPGRSSPRSSPTRRRSTAGTRANAT